MRRIAILAAAVVMATGGMARADRLTIASSLNEIALSASFTGTPLTIFGVIEREETSALPLDADYRVAVVVFGPRHSVVMRRKDRVVGVWANAASQTILNPPSVYLLNTSVDMPRLASEEVLRRLELGFDNIAFVFVGHPTVNDPAAVEFRDAFLRLKQEARLYGEDVGVNFIGNLVFRTNMRLPANLPVGDYTVVGYLFSSDGLIARDEEKFTVSKAGFEATVASFAHTQALPYGLLVVALALGVGWLGGVIFRRD